MFVVGLPGLVNARRTEKSERRARRREDQKVARRGSKVVWFGQKSTKRPEKSPMDRVSEEIVGR